MSKCYACGAPIRRGYPMVTKKGEKVIICERCNRLRLWEKARAEEEKANNCEPQYDIDKGTIKCDNCSENGSYKCSKCDGEMYFKRLEVETEPTGYNLSPVEDEPQTERSE